MTEAERLESENLTPDLRPFDYRDLAACLAVACGVAASWIVASLLVMAAWRVAGA